MSLVPELLHGTVVRPQQVISQFYIPNSLKLDEPPLKTVSLRWDRYNYIHDIARKRFHLYDFRSDYWEKKDLIDSPEHQDVARRMRQELSLFLADLPTSHATRTDERPKRPANAVGAARGHREAEPN
jgi:hypothetical protein